MLSNVSNWCQIASVLVVPIAIWGWKKLNRENHNNGGSTVRDAIDRIESKVTELSADAKATRKAVKKLDKKHDALDQKLDEHLADFEE